ncbi:MAG TPA: hypothetical protein VF874_18840, partial [Mycobacterium sp.]
HAAPNQATRRGQGVTLSPSAEHSEHVEAGQYRGAVQDLTDVSNMLHNHCRDTLPYPLRLAIDAGDVLNDLESVASPT